MILLTLVLLASALPDVGQPVFVPLMGSVGYFVTVQYALLALLVVTSGLERIASRLHRRS